MARASLREYQLALSERLQDAAAGTRVPTKLGLRAGGEAWLVDLKEAGEVIPVPPIAAVPLARAWFKGVTNVRGNLYTVTDLAAFAGASPAQPAPRNRLLLVGQRHDINAALFVDSVLGLRNVTDFAERTSSSQTPPWVQAAYADRSGERWQQLDVPALLRAAQFLDVAA